jgi:hypothetical protein
LLSFNGVCAYLRESSNDKVIVIINPRGSQFNFRVPIKKANMNGLLMWRDLLSGQLFEINDGDICIPKLDEKQGLILIQEPD